MRVIKKKLVGKKFQYLVEGFEDFKEGEEIGLVGTGQQNRFFHKLLGVVYATKAWVGALSSLSGDEQEKLTPAAFRHFVKLEFGLGAEYFLAMDMGGKIEYLKEPPTSGIYRAVFAHPVSWTKYSKKERMATIEKFLAWVEPMGIDFEVEEYRKEYFINPENVV